MKNFLLITILSLLTLGFTFGQATDFTTNDCNGVTHNLFDSLDAGNVIVIAWVMPCSPCATYSMPAYSAVQSFSSSHPGRVHFYMADDYANTSCSSLSSWGNNYNMPNSTFFSTSAINMNGYGVAGMPKVVVLGGTSHTIYFNQNDSHINFQVVKTAIDSALANYLVQTTWNCLNGGCIDPGDGSGMYTDSLTCVTNCITNDINNLTHNDIISVFPNPTNDFLNISYKIVHDENIKFEIIDLLGETVLSFNDNLLNTIGENKKTLDIRNLNSGIYFLHLSSPSNSETLKFVVSH